MAAKCLPSILPQMSHKEQLELSKIYSVSGLLSSADGLVNKRPFRAPHHTISTAGLCGGGSNPKPGEISLATSGVLFLDELTEFSRQTLETLRQPLEEKAVTIARAGNTITYHAESLSLWLLSGSQEMQMHSWTDQAISVPYLTAFIRSYRSYG